jgi:hypothetical protein
MHARIEQLLSLRDGEPVDARVREHVATCAECAATLASADALRARLQALPELEPAADGGFAAVLERRDRADHRAALRIRAGRIAVAASIVAIAFGAAWRFADERAPPSASARPELTATGAAEALALDRVAQLQSRSAALEAALAAIGNRPAVERAGTALPIDTLEAQVQWIDYQLLANADALAAETLWRDRVEAMDSLVRLRYVEAQRVAAL